jgi:collagenase-like PrtC family protease
VKCYKEAIASVLDDTFTDEKKDAWDHRLATVFNRGFWTATTRGRPWANGIATTAPTLPKRKSTWATA